MLLLDEKGAPHFLELKTFHGIPYPPNREAAVAKGIASHSIALRRTMQEAVTSSTPNQISQLDYNCCT